MTDGYVTVGGGAAFRYGGSLGWGGEWGDPIVGVLALGAAAEQPGLLLARLYQSIIIIDRRRGGRGGSVPWSSHPCAKVSRISSWDEPIT